MADKVGRTNDVRRKKHTDAQIRRRLGNRPSGRSESNRLEDLEENRFDFIGHEPIIITDRWQMIH